MASVASSLRKEISPNENNNCDNMDGQMENEDEGDMKEKLILLVQSFPILYDQSLAEFRNKNERDATWKGIGASLNITALECQSKWKHLRDSYTRELRRMTLSKRFGKPPAHGWRYFKLMGFLEGHLKARRRRVKDADSASSRVSLHHHIAKSENEQPLEESETNEIYLGTSNSMNASTSASVRSGRQTPEYTPPPPPLIAAKGSRSKRKRKNKVAELTNEIRLIRESFMELSSLMLSTVRSNRPPTGRFDGLCLLMASRYNSLPVELKNEFDIEVLKLLISYTHRCPV